MEGKTKAKNAISTSEISKKKLIEILKERELEIRKKREEIEKELNSETPKRTKTKDIASESLNFLAKISNQKEEIASIFKEDACKLNLNEISDKDPDKLASNTTKSCGYQHVTPTKASTNLNGFNKSYITCNNSPRLKLMSSTEVSVISERSPVLHKSNELVLKGFGKLIDETIKQNDEGQFGFLSFPQLCQFMQKIKGTQNINYEPFVSNLWDALKLADSSSINNDLLADTLLLLYGCKCLSYKSAVETMQAHFNQAEIFIDFSKIGELIRLSKEFFANWQINSCSPKKNLEHENLKFKPEINKTSIKKDKKSISSFCGEEDGKWENRYKYMMYRHDIVENKKSQIKMTEFDRVFFYCDIYCIGYVSMHF